MCKEKDAVFGLKTKSKEELVCGEIFIMNIVYVLYGLRRQPTSVLALGWGDNTLHVENLRMTVLQRFPTGATAVQMKK